MNGNDSLRGGHPRSTAKIGTHPIHPMLGVHDTSNL